MKKGIFLALFIGFALMLSVNLTGYTQEHAYKFIDGEDWNYIEGLDIEQPLKIKMKALLLRATHESSVIANAPVVEASGPIIDYLPALDNFYDNPENKPLPLYFSLQIVDMQQKGIPDEKIDTYKSNLITKLEDAGVIQEPGEKLLHPKQINGPSPEKTDAVPEGEPKSFWERIFGQ